jgi:hypothetical protein
MKIDWTRLPLQGEAKSLGDLFGNDIGIALAGEGQRFSSVLGPNAAARAAELLDSEVGEPRDSWLKKSQNQAFFLILRPARLLRPLSSIIPELAENKAMIDSLSDDPIFIRGRSEGGALYIEGSLPAKLIATMATMDQ